MMSVEHEAKSGRTVFLQIRTPPLNIRQINLVIAHSTFLYMLAGCGTSPIKSCNLASPPPDAKATVTHGLDIIMVPRPIPVGFTGCAYVWLGDSDNRAAMTKLSTAYFEAGQVRWYDVQEPDEPARLCIFKQGALVADKSKNARACPNTEAQVPRW